MSALSNFRTGPMGPAVHCFEIAPHATDLVTPTPKAIRADTAGTVTLRAIDSSEDVTLNMAAGEIIPVMVAYVRAEGTTATLQGFA